MPLVTLSAPFGAGGSEIGPELARRLEVPFLDRAIPAAVAESLAVPLDEAMAHDQSAGSVLGRLVRSLAPLSNLYVSAVPLPGEIIDEGSYREATERAIREQASTGTAVILGRVGAVVLRDEPRALHVRLDGPPNHRIAQAMRLQKIDRETAERRLAETDRAREAYAQHFYGVDMHDPALYHLVVDSTAIMLDACVELIAVAARARAAAAEPG